MPAMRLVTFAVGLLLSGGCARVREQPRETGETRVTPEDAAGEVAHLPDTALPLADTGRDALAEQLMDLLTDLGDASKSETLVGEARVVSVKVEPKGALPDAEAAVARGRFRFRACAHPGDAGASDVMLRIKVGEGGEVVSASVPTHPAGSCLRAAAEKLRFLEPAGGAASVDLVLRVSW